MATDPSRPVNRVNLRRRISSNLLVLGGSSGIGALLSMLATAANSRALTLTEFGTFVLLQASALMLAGLMQFSTQQPIIKMGELALHGRDARKFEAYVGLGLVVDFLSAFTAAALSMMMVVAIPGTLGLSPEVQAAAMPVCASLLFQGYRTSEGVLRVLNRFRVIGFVQVASAVVQLITALLLWWLDAPFFFYALLAAQVMALPSVMQLAAALWLMRGRQMRPRYADMLQSSPDRRAFLSYCLRTHVMGTCDSARNFGDSILVGAIVSVEAASVYNVSKQLAGVLRKASTIYSSVIFPEFARMAADGRYDDAVRVGRKAALLCLAATLLLAAAASALGAAALHIVFGPAFAAGHWILVVLVVTAGLQLVSTTYSMLVQAFAGPALVLRAYLVATSAFLVTAVGGLPLMGAIAAAWGQAGFMLVLIIMCMRAASPRSGLGGDRRFADRGGAGNRPLD